MQLDISIYRFSVLSAGTSSDERGSLMSARSTGQFTAVRADQFGPVAAALTDFAVIRTQFAPRARRSA